MKNSVLSILALASLMAAADGYDLKSLVEPISFSCELRDVRLTRVIDRMRTGGTSVDRDAESSSARHTISSAESLSAEHMAGVASSHRDEEGQRTERQFNVGGSVKWGWIPTGRVGGEYTRTGSDDSRRTTDITVSGKGSIENKSSTGGEQTSSRGKDRTTEKIDESFVGSYRLDFSVVLRNLDSTDKLDVLGTKMRARLTCDELPGPVTVRYEERGDFSLGAEETICSFTYLIEDLKTLKALLRLDREGMLGRLQLSKSGADIVVMSEKTGRNVLSDMNAVEKHRPGTIFFVEFGELAMLPEWRVSRRHSAKSGPRGSRVNMREALLAIQGAAVDNNEELPEVVFTFADDGALSKVVDRPLVDKDNEGRYRMFALRLTKTNGETEVCLPNAEIMKVEISNYSKVALFSFGLDELAHMSLLHPQYFSRLSKEVAKYLDGFSDKKAYEFYNKALNNVVDTWVQVGLSYKYGEGVAKDKKEAVKWFRKAAEQGAARAQFALGDCYYKGEGIEQDEKEAVKWYRKAADQGLADAQYNLGVCYYDGKGVEEDKKEAVKWFGKAADQGDADALKELRRITGER